METGAIDHRPSGFERLAELVETLRGENGCPWDKKQTARSMAVQLLEETHELVDAISMGRPGAVCEELGDVLFHIFFLARLFEEKGQFDIQAVAAGITRKMVRRHPHVFGESTVNSAEEVREQWHKIKQEEKTNAGADSVLDSVSTSLPALMRAYRMSERAARDGFDWEDITGVMEKVEEEWHELKEAIAHRRKIGEPDEAVLVEFGDLLFTLANVARFLRFHPETALTASIVKFEKRFRDMERKIKEAGREMTSVSQKEKDDIWESVKS